MLHQLIEHHTKYREIHGVDETIWMTRSEHKMLHNRLRGEKKCKISGPELAKIARKASHRTVKQKLNKLVYKHKFEGNIRFTDTLVPNIRHHENINYNYKTGVVSCSCFFEGDHSMKLMEVNL